MTSDMTSPDDARTRELYLAFFETCAMMNKVPGGRDGALILMVVGLAGMDGKCTNVSSIAECLGMSRRKVKRKLEVLVEEGLVRRVNTTSNITIYCRDVSPETTMRRQQWVDAAFEIWHRHLGTAK